MRRDRLLIVAVVPDRPRRRNPAPAYSSSTSKSRFWTSDSPPRYPMCASFSCKGLRYILTGTRNNSNSSLS